MRFDNSSFFSMKCPSCKSKIVFHGMAKGYGIKVNCESKGEVHVPGMTHLWKACRNPLCEWSKVEDAFK